MPLVDCTKKVGAEQGVVNVGQAFVELVVVGEGVVVTITGSGSMTVVGYTSVSIKVAVEAMVFTSVTKNVVGCVKVMSISVVIVAISSSVVKAVSVITRVKLSTSRSVAVTSAVL